MLLQQYNWVKDSKINKEPIKKINKNFSVSNVNMLDGSINMDAQV